MTIIPGSHRRGPVVHFQRRDWQILIDLTPTWEANPPVWELRIGAYRVFYDVDEDEKVVYVRAVRDKPPIMRTEDIV